MDWLVSWTGTITSDLGTRDVSGAVIFTGDAPPSRHDIAADVEASIDRMAQMPAEGEYVTRGQVYSFEWEVESAFQLP